MGRACLPEGSEERLSFRKQAEERLTDQALRPGCEKVLRGRVGIAHDEALVERDHRGGEELEPGE